jgi:hypothetical protein
MGGSTFRRSASGRSTGHHAGTFSADVVTALRNIPKMIDQRLQFGPFSHEQRFTVEC